MNSTGTDYPYKVIDDRGMTETANVQVRQVLEEKPFSITLERLAEYRAIKKGTDTYHKVKGFNKFVDKTVNVVVETPLEKSKKFLKDNYPDAIASLDRNGQKALDFVEEKSEYLVGSVREFDLKKVLVNAILSFALLCQKIVIGLLSVGVFLALYICSAIYDKIKDLPFDRLLQKILDQIPPKFKEFCVKFAKKAYNFVLEQSARFPALNKLLLKIVDFVDKNVNNQTAQKQTDNVIPTKITIDAEQDALPDFSAVSDDDNDDDSDSDIGSDYDN
eukprot:TRINITY_DN2990_c0_g1_i1.p1 TRINITY_DN2990_c0_g1~~TRINITY_DN2990_c0_g1_i1.p1  ORF type:complete len:275 (-),score=50.97 TRINITY_DN2990_c0_g1_i1:101-925(-)